MPTGAAMMLYLPSFRLFTRRERATALSIRYVANARFFRAIAEHKRR